MDTKMTLAMEPSSSVTALTTTNTYNVNVTDMLKREFPCDAWVETAVQYQNPSGWQHAATDRRRG